MRGALERVFGEQFLQIGAWGAAQHVLALRAHPAPCARRLAPRRRRRPDLRSPSISPSPATPSMRCCCRIRSSATRRRMPCCARSIASCVPTGTLIVLSFASGGLWGLRHLLSSGGYPQGRDHVMREGRLRDWLELLSFDVPAATRYCHTLPIERSKQLQAPAARGVGAALAADVQRRLPAACAETRASVDAGTPLAAPAAPARRRRARGADDARARTRAFRIRHPSDLRAREVGRSVHRRRLSRQPRTGRLGRRAARRRARQGAVGRRARRRPTIAWSSRPRSRRSRL